MASPPRPKWLPTSGPGNLNVPPEKWGMTLRQWVAVIEACRVCEETWEELRADTNRKEAGYVNLYQICDRYVKPWTRNLGNSIALLLNEEKPLKAEVMISHAWGEDIIESMVAVLGRASTSGISLDTAIWFCTFAQYQPGDMEGDCGPGVAAQLALDPFKQVIASNPRYGMLVIHTSVCDLYGRLWCVYEVNAAEDDKVVTSAAPSMLYCVQTCKQEMALCETRPELSEVEREDIVCRVNAEEAACWSKDDEKMIKGQIEAGIGYEALNKKILEFRKAAIQRMANACGELMQWCQELNMDVEVMDVLTSLASTVRTAGNFVGLHCLTQLADGHEDEAYMQQIMKIARQEGIEGQDCTDSEGNDMGCPPLFDPRKRNSNEFIASLMEDDELLMRCLRDLADFQNPIGWIELGAGGNIMAQMSLEVDPKDKFQIKYLFQQFDTDGDGTISLLELKQVFVNLDAGLSDNDIDVMFMAADGNQDGKIGYAEFIDWVFESGLAG